MLSRWIGRLSDVRRICFDSNSLIYALENRPLYSEYVGAVLQMLQKRVARGYISTIVEMELLVKPMREKSTFRLESIEIFLRQMPNLTVREVNRAIARRAAEVRARSNLASIDALIAATAIEERCDVIIGNDAVMASKLRDVPYLYLTEYI